MRWRGRRARGGAEHDNDLLQTRLRVASRRHAVPFAKCVGYVNRTAVTDRDVEGFCKGGGCVGFTSLISKRRNAAEDAALTP